MYYKEPTEAAPRDLDLASTVTRAPPRLSHQWINWHADVRLSNQFGIGRNRPISFPRRKWNASHGIRCGDVVRGKV